MTSALLAFAIVYGVTWLVLLVDCIRRKEFAGPIGSTAADRGFWLLAFVLFDPLLLGLYLLLVRLRWAWTAAWRPAVFIAALAAVVVLRASPIGEVPGARVVAVRGADGVFDVDAFRDAKGRSFGVGLQTQFQGTSGSSSFGTHPGVALHARFVRVQLLDDHPALREAALELGIALTRLGFVDRVECVLEDETPQDEGPGPDLTVLLDLDVETDLELLVLNRFVGTLDLAVARTPWASDTLVARGDDRADVARVECGGSLAIRSWRLGYAIGTARHDALTGAMTAWLRDTVAGQIEEIVADTGALPAPPASWTGTYRAPDDLPVLAEELGGTRVHASSGFLCDAHVVWTVELGDDVEAAIARLHGDLEELGFRVWRRSPAGEVPILEARRAGETVRTRVHVSRARFPTERGGFPMFLVDGTSESRELPSRYAIDVFDDFSDSRLQALAAAAVAGEQPVQLALALGRHVRDEDRGRMIERSASLRDARALRAAAGVARREGRTEAAAELLRRGHEIARARGQDTDTFESEATEHGVVLSARGEPFDVPLLTAAGFVALDEDVIGSQVVELGEDASFVSREGSPVAATLRVVDGERGEEVLYRIRVPAHGVGVSGRETVARLAPSDGRNLTGVASSTFWCRVDPLDDGRGYRVHFRWREAR